MSRAALVSGAASGIGRATASLLGDRGFAVIGLDRAPPPPGLAHAGWILCDLADPAALVQALAGLRDQPLAAMVLAAGVAGVGSVEHVLRVNFLAPRALLDGLADNVADGGAITLVSSGAGWRWCDRRDRLVEAITAADPDAALAIAAGLCADPAEAYVRSKELLCALVAHGCLRHWPRAVRLNCVSPGSVETPLLGDFTASMGREAMEYSRATVGRDGTADEVAEVIAFLCGDGARWINGADIRVDGGLVGALSAGAAQFAGWA